jgi:hypothetical protein
MTPNASTENALENMRSNLSPAGQSNRHSIGSLWRCAHRLQRGRYEHTAAWLAISSGGTGGTWVSQRKGRFSCASIAFCMLEGEVKLYQFPSKNDRPHSGRGGCLGGVARPDGEVKVVFFLSKNLVTLITHVSWGWALQKPFLRAKICRCRWWATDSHDVYRARRPALRHQGAEGPRHGQDR